MSSSDASSRELKLEELDNVSGGADGIGAVAAAVDTNGVGIGTIAAAVATNSIGIGTIAAAVAMGKL